jgi:hypothetical protein
VGDPAPGSHGRRRTTAKGLLENRLRAVIVHAWSRPNDPVVVALREEALEMMAALDRLRAQVFK